jgi:hypothetical protein
MKIKQSAKMFSILSDGIYKDKILAVIREYVCNAYDAHVTVGKKDVPFTVRLPSYLDSTFSVSDEGSGIEPHGHRVGDHVIPGPDADGNFEPHLNIGEIFWTYGESSKTNDENTIGALGLGSKSAFAYTKSSFIVKNRFEGTEYTYFCFINEDGEPEGSCVGEAPAEGNGITVEFAIRPEDQGAFYDRFGRLFKHWANVKPNVIGVEPTDVFEADPKKIIQGKGWYLSAEESSYNRSTALAIMGNVAYPIESASIPNLPAGLKIIADNPFVITVPLGNLEFAASRESLSYTEFTCDQLIKRLDEVRVELATSFYDKVFTDSKDHLSFYYAFAKTFAEFRKVVYVPSTRYGNNDEEANTIFTSLLLDKTSKDSIEFKGADFTIKSLIEGKYSDTRNLYQSYGLYAPSHRGTKSGRYYLHPQTVVSAEITEAADSKDFYPDSYKYDIDAGDKVIDKHEWRGFYVSPRAAKLSTFDLVVQSAEKFEFKTINNFNIDMKEGKITFVINDVGNSGRDRFKALSTDKSTVATLGLGQMIYVEFNSKVSKVEEVLIDLKKVIADRLTGSEIELLSKVPDLRPVIEKVKVDRESIKLKGVSYEVRSSTDLAVAADYISDLSINYRVNGLFKKNIEKIYSLSDLKAKTAVPYFIKRRSRTALFNDVGSTLQAFSDQDELRLPTKLGFFDEVMTEEQSATEVTTVTNDDGTRTSFPKVIKKLQVIIINEGQHAYLLKKGVKLVSIKTLISEKIEAAEAAEKFTDEIRRVITLSKVRHLKGMYDSMVGTKGIDDWATAPSMLKVLFSEYSKLRNQGAQYALMFAKLTVLKMVKSIAYVNYDAQAIDLIAKLEAQYPMLELVSYHGINYAKALKIICYVERIDGLITQAVIDTEEEIADDLVRKDMTELDEIKG